MSQQITITSSPAKSDNEDYEYSAIDVLKGYMKGTKSSAKFTPTEKFSHTLEKQKLPSSFSLFCDQMGILCNSNSIGQFRYSNSVTSSKYAKSTTVADQAQYTELRAL